jgi:dihydroorotate dehydrogenase (fumarate)
MTMDLSTSYLGFTLPHPIMPGASPLADDLDIVRRLEDAGAAAIVMRSVFEEQVSQTTPAGDRALESGDASTTTPSFFPRASDYALGPTRYLEQVRRVKAAVSLPVIASLNCTTPEGWVRYPRLIQQAGADAMELNFYHVATDPGEDGSQVERRLLEIVRLVRRAVTIPFAVKLSPFFSSLPHLACSLEAAGADGLVLFNPFYQPDIDPEMTEAVPRLQLSTSADLLLRLRWIAILSGQTRASIAASGGVHTGDDVVRAVLAGAHAVQTVAGLLRLGPKQIAILRRDLSRWLEEREYVSLRQAQGSMSLLRCPNPEAFERGNYIRALQSWRV